MHLIFNTFTLFLFSYNNIKNTNISHIFFKLNCEYHLYISYEQNLNPYSKSKITKKLFSKLQNLIAIYQQNFYYIQELQKQ